MKKDENDDNDDNDYIRSSFIPFTLVYQVYSCLVD